LPREQAFAEVCGEDRRPLLVVRECAGCKGTDDALLSRRLKNERTILMTRWFRCVKLPNHVLEQDHSFRHLFAEESPPHLFVCRYDGSELVGMDGQQTQSELWKAMESLIHSEYEGRADRILKGLLRCLDGYDAIDSRTIEINRQLEDRIDRKGADDARVRKLQAQIEALAAEKLDIDERWNELLAKGLELREPEEGEGGEAEEGSEESGRKGEDDGDESGHVDRG
jgi:hypothetical protein